MALFNFAYDAPALKQNIQLGDKTKNGDKFNEKKEYVVGANICYAFGRVFIRVQ